MKAHTIKTTHPEQSTPQFKNTVIIKQLRKGAVIFYFIRKGIRAIFFSAIPVPRTTARSGSSAT